jgi:hypothetical protein
MAQFQRKVDGEGKGFAALTLGCVAALALAGCGGGGGGGGGGGSASAASTATTTSAATALTALDLFPSGDVAIFGSASNAAVEMPAQQIIVEGYYADGSTADLTRNVTYSIANPQVASVTGDGLITPTGPAGGKTTITVSQPGANGQTLTVTRNIIVSPNQTPGSASTTASSVELYPGPVTKLSQVNPTTGQDQFQQFVTLVRFADGTCLDLSRNFGLTVTDQNGNPTVAARATTSGLLRATQNGLVMVTANCAAYNMVASVNVICGTGNGTSNGFTPYTGGALAGSTNPFDVVALSALQAQQIEPVALSGDVEFLRRVTADVIGRLPTTAEVSAFLADTSPTKRADKIAALLAMPAYGNHWGNDVIGPAFWTTNGTALTPTNATITAMTAFDAELVTELNNDVTLDQVAQSVISLQGPLGSNFAGQLPMAYQQCDTVMLVLTGMTSKCARCHNHHLTTPLDDPMWVQNDNYSLYAFFAQSAADATEIDINGNPVVDPTTNQPITRQPGWVVDGYENAISTGLPALTDPIATRLQSFGNLMVKSHAFRRGFGHRIWTDVMAEMLNPNQFLQANLAAVANPKMLEQVAQSFQDQKFSLKSFLSLILNSKVYQLTTAGSTTTNDPLLARRTVRRHHSEVLNSGVAAIAGVPYTQDSFFSFNFGYPAINVATTEVTPRNDDVNMSQAFTLMNSTHATNGLMVMTGNQIDALAAQVDSKAITMQDAINTIFLAALQREPSTTEMSTFMTENANAATTSDTFLQDVAVAVGSSIEYVMR